jgi:hypothetical protein
MRGTGSGASLAAPNRDHPCRRMTMNDRLNDQAVIQQSYEAVVDKLYGVFNAAYILALANHDDQGKTHAEDAFSSGLLLARQARDRALALLP